MGLSSPDYHPGPKGDELIGYFHQLVRILSRRLTLPVCPVRAGERLDLMYIHQGVINRSVDVAAKPIFDGCCSRIFLANCREFALWGDQNRPRLAQIGRIRAKTA